MIHYTALALSIALNAISLILLKSYALSTGAAGAEKASLRRFFDIRLIVSVFLYGLAAVLWLIALLGVDLMVAYPSLALTYVVIGLAAPRLFAEEISPRRWAGVLVIIVGVILLNV
jgi:small multidrug resistance pump